MNKTIDEITLNRTVMFTGTYFTLLTTVKLEESLRVEGEDDDEFAIRLAGIWMGEYYGWDVIGAAHEAGVVED
jgi:hypothetical protein